MVRVSGEGVRRAKGLMKTSERREVKELTLETSLERVQGSSHVSASWCLRAERRVDESESRRDSGGLLGGSR